MPKQWIALALVMALGGGLVGCNDDNRGGGGGQADPEQLPESNNINPSPREDTYIDEETEREAEDRKAMP